MSVQNKYTGETDFHKTRRRFSVDQRALCNVVKISMQSYEVGPESDPPVIFCSSKYFLFRLHMAITSDIHTEYICRYALISWLRHFSPGRPQGERWEADREKGRLWLQAADTGTTFIDLLNHSIWSTQFKKRLSIDGCYFTSISNFNFNYMATSWLSVISTGIPYARWKYYIAGNI